MTLIDHLRELRKRLFASAVGLLLIFFVVYHFAEDIFDFLIRPLCLQFETGKCPMVYTSVTEPFLVYLKVGITGALFVGAPWIFFQIWLFVSPGLKPSERRWVIPFVLVSSVMFLVGGAMGYFGILPFAFEFFLSQARESIQPMLSMSDYLTFTAGLLLAFGVLFEIPVLVVLLNLIGVLPAATLWKTWRYGVCGIYILAAILTPADPYTMLLLGTPLVVFYIASLILCSILEKVRKS